MGIPSGGVSWPKLNALGAQLPPLEVWVTDERLYNGKVKLFFDVPIVCRSLELRVGFVGGAIGSLFGDACSMRRSGLPGGAGCAVEVEGPPVRASDLKPH